MSLRVLPFPPREDQRDRDGALDVRGPDPLTEVVDEQLLRDALFRQPRRAKELSVLP